MEWGDVLEENVPWDKEEDRFFLADVYDTYDLLADFAEIGTNNQRLFNDIVDAIEVREWCQRDWQVLSRAEALKVSWDRFVHEVKHVQRFVFIQHDQKISATESLGVEQLLQTFGKVVERMNRLIEVPEGTEIFRARLHDVNVQLSSASELGTVPTQYAKRANRMSPAGIPAFYGALDPCSSLVETFDKEGPFTATQAKFIAKEPFLVLDLTDLPCIPSIFDVSEGRKRSELSFLHHFLDDLAMPIERDGREHIEYVPTQIVTEYFRYSFLTLDGERVRGILYPSSRTKGSACVLFFFELGVRR